MATVRVTEDARKLLNTMKKRMGFKSISDLLFWLAGNPVSNMGLKFEKRWLPYIQGLTFDDIPVGSVIEEPIGHEIVYCAISIGDLKTMFEKPETRGWFYATLGRMVEVISAEARNKYNWKTEPIFAVKDLERGKVILYSIYPKHAKE